MDWKLPAGAALATLVGVTVLGLYDRERGVDQASHDNGASAPRQAMPAAVSQADALDAMAELLDREVEERLRLEDEIADLRTRLARLEMSAPQSAPSPVSSEPRPIPRSAGGSRGEVSQATFLEAGFEPERAAYLQRTHDEITMAQLYLRDQASREGWLQSQRFREEQRLLQQRLDGLRGEMNEDEYGRYLYALGRPNQVSIRRVLAGSAAETAGIEAGDVLTRYDGQRIYALAEVRGGSRNGEPGETVSVEVLRDGRRIQTYLPRGPLGVSMSSTRALPDAPGS